MNLFQWHHVLSEDDAAPDARQAFYREAEKIIGVTMDAFMKNTTPHESGDGMTIWRTDGTYKLEISADDPYYRLYKKEP